MWGALLRRRSRVATRVERWPTPDGDLLEIHRVDAPIGRPRLLLLHGLEGSVRSHYVGGILTLAAARGWGADLLVFRGCGSTPNRARRFYHSGETTDLAFVVTRILDESRDGPLLLAGVSLGGNVLLKWLGELSDGASPRIKGAVAVSVPFDLARGARHISRGLSKLYERRFLTTLRRRALAKLAVYPDLYTAESVVNARTIWEFDDVVTAPVHGFTNAAEYYARSSSLAWLEQIRVPTLLVSAADDPFLPRDVLDDVRRVALGNRYLTLNFLEQGGHVGFVEGRMPGRAKYYAERRLITYLEQMIDV